MPSSSIRVDTEFRSRRDAVRGGLDRALPHRRFYLGFALGLLSTVVVGFAVLAALGWWATKSGLIYFQINV
jgi:hypothetical protein